MTYRTIPLTIILMLVTCGIYNIYWFIVTTNEIEANLREKDGSVNNGGMAFVFAIITCGIYYFYWHFKQGARMAQLGRENNVNITDNGVAYLILSIFGLGLIADILIQSDINRIVSPSHAI